MLKLRSLGTRDNNTYRINTTEKSKISENSITYEGIFNEYSFNLREEHELLFNTTYSCAISKNIDTGSVEYYFCLETVSKLDGEGLEKHGGRPPMNFAFALDISGSMDSPFSKGDTTKTKLDVAKECLINLLSKLKPKDKFGLILFNTAAIPLIPLNTVESSDVSAIKAEILGVRSKGGTSILAGLHAAEDMLLPQKIPVEAMNNNMNRMLFLTDLNPSTNESQQLIDFGHSVSAKGVFLSVVGIGVDFNSDLSFKLGKIKGCLTYSVSSAAEFRKQMIDDFDHSALVIVSDVSLRMESSEFEVEEIYGSPSTPDKNVGEVMKIDSASPSSRASDGIHGGVVLMKLKRKDPAHTCGDSLSLSLNYKDWNDKSHSSCSVFQFPELPKDEVDYYQNFSVRKAVALVRYVTLVKQVLKNPGNPRNKEILEKCKKYFISEVDGLHDPSLDKEILMLDTHIKNLEGATP